jgi:hypothetical protein
MGWRVDLVPLAETNADKGSIVSASPQTHPARLPK